MYGITATNSLLAYMVFQIPTKEEIIYESKSNSCFYLSIFLFILAFALFMIANADLEPIDLEGVAEAYEIKKEGMEYPRPFKMKKLSRLSLSCRHLMDTSSMLMMVSQLIYG